MNLAARKLLQGVGLISLGASFSTAITTNLRHGFQAPAGRNDGNTDCGDGEQYMQIKTAPSLPWLDEYTITWRQLTDACTSPVATGFEATGYFKTAGRIDQDEDGSPELSIGMCAPHGYYELEVKITGDNIANHDNSQDIQWQIDAASNENLTITKWSGKAEISKPSLQSTFVWPLKNEAGSPLEKMWSGPAPQACTETRKSDLTLEEPTTETGIVGGVSDLSTPGTFDEGCYDYLANKHILTAIGAPSSVMTIQRCKYRCQSRGYLYSAAANGKHCLCGVMPPSQKKALDYCDVPCPGDSRFMCGGNGKNWYLSITRMLETSEPPGAVIRRRLSMDEGTESSNSVDTSLTGAAGPAGAAGANGANGNNGLDGMKGEKGETGATGANGQDGKDGARGEKGEKGEPGKVIFLTSPFSSPQRYHDDGDHSNPTYNDVPYHDVLEPDTHYGASALGCFKVTKYDRILAGDNKSSAHMSAKVCGHFCQGEGYAFFGTLHSTRCLCGNHFEYKGEVDGHYCNNPCSGKPSAACGGISHANVYKFDGHSHAKADETKLVQPRPYNRLGCFEDDKSNRVLDLKVVYKLQDMTPEKCYWHCTLVPGAVYYGLQFGRECFCGGRESKYYHHPLEESSCTMPCPGDNEKYCGGTNAMTVYGPRHGY